jgi:hypothetical protein
MMGVSAGLALSGKFHLQFHMLCLIPEEIGISQEYQFAIQTLMSK